MCSYSLYAGLKQTLLQTTLLAYNDPPDGYDVVIKFHSAKNLPKMNIVRHMNPYFVAKIDDRISYTSSIMSNTSAPVWNSEEWIVRNIPLSAQMIVKVYDKDDDKITDDYIGRVDIKDLINYDSRANGHKIIGAFNQNNGRFYLSIQTMRSSEETKQLPRYTFDGPCRYSRHDSLIVVRLTMLNADCVYSTWKIQMRRIPFFFLSHERQHWNKEYKSAQAIFGGHPLSLAYQSPIKLAHKILHGRTLKHDETRHLTSANDLWKSVFTDRTTQRIKPCVYTYIIDDNTWRFSETGVRFFVDYASKHALLANCSEHVRYAGEFHPRPKYGWDRYDDEWELVFDNGSGTYSPNPELFSNLKELLSFNFPGLNIVTYDYKDPRLKESIIQLRLFFQR